MTTPELRPCRHFKKYKAIYPPKCNCKPCHDKWNTRADIAPSGEDAMEVIYQEYLKIANSETDPWHKTELRNSAYAVKTALLRAAQSTPNPDEITMKRSEVEKIYVALRPFGDVFPFADKALNHDPIEVGEQMRRNVCYLEFKKAYETLLILEKALEEK